jgi:hypothetical protein
MTEHRILEGMKAVAAIAVGVVAGFLLALGLVSAGLLNVGDEPSTSTGPPVVLPQPLDASFVDSWVRGCVAQGESRAFCRCAINVYAGQLHPWEFQAASAVAVGGGELAELPENVRDAVDAVEHDCR